MARIVYTDVKKVDVNYVDARRRSTGIVITGNDGVSEDIVPGLVRDVVRTPSGYVIKTSEVATT